MDEIKAKKIADLLGTDKFIVMWADGDFPVYALNNVNFLEACAFSTLLQSCVISIAEETKKKVDDCYQ
jgi:hypothetical protein